MSTEPGDVESWGMVQQIVKRVEALEKKALLKQKKKLAGMFDKINKVNAAVL